MVKKKRQSEPEDDCGESTESCDESTASSCPHVKKAIDINKLRKVLKPNGFLSECSECAKKPTLVGPLNENEAALEAVADLDGEVLNPSLWMCLRCGSQLCGRTHNRHALQHYTTPHSDSHVLAINTSSLIIYCYSCSRELKHGNNKKLNEVIDIMKKQTMSNSKVNNVDDKRFDIPPIQLGTVLYIPVSMHSSHLEENTVLQRVRGLTNLGNTCFFNSVLQCLVQTPYLRLVLKNMSEPGEKFQLPGGKMKIPLSENEKTEGEEANEKEIELPPISGELQKWGPLTENLSDTLDKLQLSGKFDVYNPSNLFNSVATKYPQFGGGEQHDSHELLRHLLEGVRNEDLRRYQSVVLQKLDLDSREKRSDLDQEKKLKVKFYGQQASDMMLRPEQVFRGCLVSTLQCQECQHSSHRNEYFLDLSLPVTAEKPQPPSVYRRKGPVPEEQVNCLGAPDENKPSKHQLKKEKQAARKLRKSKKGGANSNSISNDKQSDSNQMTDVNENKSENKSSSEQSDADVEDNLEENPKENPKAQDNSICTQPKADTAANFAAYHMESGYNSEKVISSDSIRASPVEMDKEKSDASPERLDKDKERSCFSAVAIPLHYRPLSAVDSPVPSNPDSGVASPEIAKRTLSDTVNIESPVTSKELGSPSSLSSEVNMDISSPRQGNNSPVNEIQRPVSRISFHSENQMDLIAVPSSQGHQARKDQHILSNSIDNKLESIGTELGQFKLDEEGASKGAKSKHCPALTLNVNELNNYMDYPQMHLNQSYKQTSPDSDSSKLTKDYSSFSSHFATISPRYQCDDGEYSIQSCLNQFTASELLAGNNKVGCEACTKRANNGKTVYTNATKRFLISSPPAVLILHLKRFQIGPRCMFRKITKHVSFPLILDLAPFCSEKVKNLPNVSSRQTKLLYSLYGVVEHSGSMHGGHYVAYVKVRSNVNPSDKRWNFLPPGGNFSLDDTEDNKTSDGLVNGVNGNDTDSSMSGYESGEKAAGGYDVEPLPGKWFFISDSRVQEISEEKVLKTQAYLLFYERIM